MTNEQKLLKLSEALMNLDDVVKMMVDDGMDEARNVYDEFFDNIIAIAFGQNVGNDEQTVTVNINKLDKHSFFILRNMVMTNHAVSNDDGELLNERFEELNTPAITTPAPVAKSLMNELANHLYWVARELPNCEISESVSAFQKSLAEELTKEG